MVTGCPGGDNQDINTMQTLLNIVDFGMNVQQAIEAPRWTTRAFPASPSRTLCIRAICRWKIVCRRPCVRSWLGEGISSRSPGHFQSAPTRPSYRTQSEGIVAAGADPRNSALALAW